MVPLAVPWIKAAARTVVAEVYSELEKRELEIVLPFSVSFGLPLNLIVSIGLRGALVTDSRTSCKYPRSRWLRARTVPMPSNKERCHWSIAITKCGLSVGGPTRVTARPHGRFQDRSAEIKVRVLRLY